MSIVVEKEGLLAPPFTLTKHQNVLVVRDDLIIGGTKRRVLEKWLPTFTESEFVYASPAYGYAQIALAYAAKITGKQATIFVAKRKVKHERTRKAQQYGAKIVEVPCGYLSVITAKAKEYSSTREREF